MGEVKNGDRFGGGTFIKVVLPHTCEKPDGNMGGTLDYGSEWACGCGKVYRLDISGYRGGQGYVWVKQ